MNDPANADELGLCLCYGCGQACELSSGAHRCTRCGAAIHRRKANAITRGWAFLLAALVFYIPANLLPVIHTQMLGSGSESTIGGGVLEFWEAGAWDIALMIFIASWGGPAGGGTAALRVDVQRFDTVPGRYASLDAVWRLKRVGQAELTCRTSVQTVADNSITSLVNAHQANLRKLAEAVRGSAGRGSCLQAA